MAILVLSCATSAVCTGLRSPEIRFEQIGSEAGLSHNAAVAILQDDDGFLWVGTPGGLNRFDGYEFEVYRHDPEDSRSLSDNFITTLFEDDAGRFWVGTANGLDRLDRRLDFFAHYGLQGGSKEERNLGVSSILQDASGILWVATHGGLFRYRPNEDRFDEVLPAENPEGLDHYEAIQIQLDAANDLWVLARTGTGLVEAALHHLDAQGVPLESFGVSSDWGGVQTFLIDGEGSFWIDRTAPAVFDHEARLLLPASPNADGVGWDFLEDPDGTVWIGTPRGLYRSLPGRESPPVRLELDPGARSWLHNYVVAIFRDRAGILWVGTQAGMFRHDPHANAFLQLAHDPKAPDSLSDSPVSAVHEGPLGDLWVGTYGGGLNRVDRVALTVRRFLHREGDGQSLRDDLVWSILGDDDGRLWIGTEDGLCRYDPRRDRFTWHDPPTRARSPGIFRVNDIEHGRNGELWLGTTDGLHRYDPDTGSSQRYSFSDRGSGPGSWDILTVFAYDAETIWVGSYDRIGRFDVAKGRFAPSEISARHQAGVFDIHRDDTGILWFASGQGLTRYDPRSETIRLFRDRDGLPGSVIYSILEDDDGRLWLGTGRGLSRYDDRLPAGRKFRNFDVADGIGSSEFNRHAAIRLREGQMVFGGMEGLTVFHPDEIRDNTYVPPIVLTEIQKSSREGTERISSFGLEELTLSYRDSTFSFEFSALSFTNPDKNRYAYMLEGVDEHWVDSHSRRFARYTNVPPGSYVFRVRGSNDAGVWNLDGASLRLRIQPPFWQTWWFRMAVAALVLVGLTALYRYRVAKLLEMERLRVRIASDLHDDLSSDLSGIALAMDMLGGRSGMEDRDRRQVSQVRNRSLRMLDRLRDIVWYVNPEHDSFDATIRRMRAAAETLLVGKEYRFESSLSPQLTVIALGFRRNLFLIFKEVLHNIARHSEARKVGIGIDHEGGLFSLCITDDGVGFDEGAIRAGNGLVNIRRRAAELGAEVEIDSRPGEGTRFSLRVEIARTRDGATG